MRFIVRRADFGVAHYGCPVFTSPNRPVLSARRLFPPFKVFRNFLPVQYTKTFNVAFYWFNKIDLSII